MLLWFIVYLSIAHVAISRGNLDLLPLEHDVVVSKGKLYVEGEEFFVKGLAYRPYPLGITKMDEDGWGGGGFCSSKLTQYNEWKSACYDYDVFDSSKTSADRIPPGPDHWFRSLWERDFPLIEGESISTLFEMCLTIEELGVNVLRLYNINPITQSVALQLVEENWNGISMPYGKDHRSFMDLAHEYGFKVIFPLISDMGWIESDSETVSERKIEFLIREVGNHPALLMWSIGNEWNLNTEERKPLRDRINNLISYTRDMMMFVWDRQIPITHCTSAHHQTFEPLVSKLDVDVFCANAGYGDDINDIFLGSEEYRGWAAIAQETGIPFLVGEIGQLDMNSTYLEQDPEWFNRKWKDTVSNIDNGCIGGNYFEYNDQTSAIEKSSREKMGLTYFQPAIDGITMSTDPDVFLADNVIKKPIIFESVKEGTYDGYSMNYHTDVFQYNGRSPTTIEVYKSRNNGEPIPASSSPMGPTMSWILIFLFWAGLWSCTYGV